MDPVLITIQPNWINCIIGTCMLTIIYRAYRPKEELQGPNPHGIAMYKYCFDGGLRFPLHFLFVSIFNKFHLIPSQINPNAWSKALFFLYLCVSEKLYPPSSYSVVYSDCKIYPIITQLSTSLSGFLFVFRRPISFQYFLETFLNSHFQ